MVNSPILAAVSASIVTAVIAAVTSLAVAVYSARSARRLKKLEAAQVEGNAKVAYEYEARKRLYAVCEPLLFQATEKAEDARARICSLAKVASKGELRADGSGWLGPAGMDDYYLKSTIYNLLAPITTFSILQRRLTSIDLGLDNEVRGRYEILKMVFFSFARDWELAAAGGEDGRLEYDRNKSDAGEANREELLRDLPQQYAPQGLYRGMVYLVAEALTVDAGNSTEGLDSPVSTERCMTFGEFQREWDRVMAERDTSQRATLPFWPLSPRPQSKLAPVLDCLVELFGGFHPKRKPVFWRLLITQYLLYRALPEGQSFLTPLSEDEIRSFDWRQESEEGEDFRGELEIVTVLMRDEFASLNERLSHSPSTAA